MRHLDRYQPPSFAAPIDLDLSRNEGEPPLPLATLLSRVEDSDVSRYPDTGPLRSAFAERFGLQPECVLVTAGGDDGLSRCFQANAGCRVVTTTPTFEMISRYVSQTGSELLEIPWWIQPFPVDAFVAAASNADLAVIVSPNNPTGSVISAEELRAIADTAPQVILDAAYIEFADEDLTRVALELGNVVVVRTLSKAYGMAGLRVGCLLGEPCRLDAIAGHGSPYPVSALSARLAEVALRESSTLDQVRGLSQRRERLQDGLDRLGLRPLPSQANFVLATSGSPWLVDSAAALGIAIRSFPRSEEMEGCVRMTVPRSDAELDRLLGALETALAPEALIFDLDGVIADVSQSYRRAIVATAASFGVAVTRGQIAGAKADGDANDDWELTRRLCADHGVDVALDEVIRRFEDLYQGDTQRSGLKDNERSLIDRDVLEKLGSGYRLGVVTGRPRIDAVSFLEYAGLEDLFTAVVTREDAPSKPDPAPVRLAMEMLGTERAWMLGDTIDDLNAARAAGALPIGVIAPGEDPERARRALQPAAAVLSRTTELKGLIDEKTI